MLLHDLRFYSLDNSTKYLAIGCFLLASQHENKIPFNEQWIIKELSFDGMPNWQALLESKFIEPIDCDASKMLASCKQSASQSITDNTDSTEAEILSFSKSPKRSHQEAIEIFKFWNSKPATMHHRAINGQEKAIIKALRHYAPEEIKRAIGRYSQVRANEAGKYRELYAWTLGEFLTRKEHYNIERFNAENWEAPFIQIKQIGQKERPDTSYLYGAQEP